MRSNELNELVINEEVSNLDLLTGMLDSNGLSYEIKAGRGTNIALINKDDLLDRTALNYLLKIVGFQYIEIQQGHIAIVFDQ